MTDYTELLEKLIVECSRVPSGIDDWCESIWTLNLSHTDMCGLLRKMFDVQYLLMCDQYKEGDENHRRLLYVNNLAGAFLRVDPRNYHGIHWTHIPADMCEGCRHPKKLCTKYPTMHDSGASAWKNIGTWKQAMSRSGLVIDQTYN